MAAPNGTFILPNPLTPLAFLPPDLAQEVQTAIFIQIGTLGMFIWDLLTNVAGDYELLTKFKLGIPTIVYFVSRVSTLGYQISQALTATWVPVECTAATRALKALFFVGMSSTTLLFFLRVRAIYSNSRSFQAFFLCFWLATVGCSTLDLLLVEGVRLGPTQGCIFANLKKLYAIIPAVAVLVHDTVVFIGISYKLFLFTEYSRSSRSQRRTRVQLRGDSVGFLSGKGLPALTRAVLQDGQVYYLISFFAALIVVAMLLAPGIGDYYRLVMISPHIALVNSMACRVFRNVRLGKFYEEEIPLSFASREIAFAKKSRSNDNQPGRSFSSSSGFSGSGPYLPQFVDIGKSTIERGNENVNSQGPFYQQRGSEESGNRLYPLTSQEVDKHPF
ncbi:hypothetical protein K435DRAFT_721083 [Dendrothele bispora CBS 962.96]|uniref:G-protein coupled receptors family 1 profile domain-containing protein n=1 Tax=Dendrothele bispora (strain CBS 962.96) TaxID=1314807 RepID=A0A4S8M762_DENBC|nr:hypothetical protein K435DRAFT_721083 [Dendrothele bispora CBS 962.96]